MTPVPCKFPGCVRMYGTSGTAHGYCSGHTAQIWRGEELRPLMTKAEAAALSRVKPWTDAEKSALATMRGDGHDFRQIAKALGRSVTSTRYHLDQAGLGYGNGNRT